MQAGQHIARSILPRVRLTRMTRYYVLITVFVLIAAVNTGVNVLYFALGLLLGAAVLSFFMGGWLLSKIDVVRSVPDHAIAGETVEVGYRFRNLGRRMSALAVRFSESNPALSIVPVGSLVHLPRSPRNGGTAEELAVNAPLRATRRGIIRLDRVQLSTTYPFGILERRQSIATTPQELVVYPRIGMLRRQLAMEYREAVESGAMTSNRRGGNDEFFGVREYRPGDNMRAVHWRSSARQGRLMIREMASSAPPQLVVVLNLRAAESTPDGQAAVERAVELAAALVCYGFFENFAVGLAIAGQVDAPNDATPHMGREARAQMLRRLARLNVAEINRRAAFDRPHRTADRAQWVVVTLHAKDIISDLLPSGPAAQAGPPSGGGRGGATRSVLAVDAPDAEHWVEYLSVEETARLLRERDDQSRNP